MRRLLLVLTIVGLAALLHAQGRKGMKLESSAFANGQAIPQKYTCQGQDVSPALSWSGAPEKTKSFALIVNDPDAPVGDWLHWVIYNLPPNIHELPEGLRKDEEAAGGLQNVLNDFKRTGYGGPCPPPGKAHRYFFRLYALDTTLSLKPGSTRQSIVDSMKGHILAEAELMGTYQRK